MSDSLRPHVTLQDIGIAVSAIGSMILVGIQVARFRVERSHVIVRLNVGEPDNEMPTTAHVSAAVFNRGRPAFIDGMYWRVGKDEFWIGGEAKEPNELPVDLATGRSYRIGFDLQRFQEEARDEGLALGYRVLHSDDDLTSMRLRVTDGEGHDHWARLNKDSVPHVRALVAERKRRAQERAAKKSAQERSKRTDQPGGRE